MECFDYLLCWLAGRCAYIHVLLGTGKVVPEMQYDDQGSRRRLPSGEAGRHPPSRVSASGPCCRRPDCACRTRARRRARCRSRAARAVRPPAPPSPRGRPQEMLPARRPPWPGRWPSPPPCLAACSAPWPCGAGRQVRMHWLARGKQSASDAPPTRSAQQPGGPETPLRSEKSRQKGSPPRGAVPSCLQRGRSVLQLKKRVGQLCGMPLRHSARLALLLQASARTHPVGPGSPAGPRCASAATRRSRQAAKLPSARSPARQAAPMSKQA